MFKKLLPFLTICFFCTFASAQNEIGLQLMPSIAQSTKINPAYAPKEKWVVSLPGIHGSYFHNAGSVGELLEELNDSTVSIKSGVLLKNIEANNTLRVHQELETFNVNYRLNDKIAFSLHHAAKSSNYLFYPETLPKLFLQGNSQYIGEEVSFGPDQHTFAYNEIGLGTAISLGKLTIGVKGKLLLGLGDISVTNNDLALYTDPDIYQLTFRSDYQINTATFTGVLLLDSLSGFSAEYGFKEMLKFESFQTSNKGYAFDFGLSYEVSDKLTIGASIVDIGKINWEKDVFNNISKGSFSFGGLDLKGALTGDSVSLATAIDTVQTILAFEATSEPYSTRLPAKVYLNANYIINNKFSIAAAYNNESYRGRSFHAFGLGGQYTFNKNISFGLTYNVRNGGYFNIGLNLTARKGPIQLFLSTDNAAVLVKPYNNDNVNARAGLNLIFNRFKEKEG